VTDVAREVGIDGKLGGQARVPGAAGLWRDLTDNVNQLAANLTTQVRAIAEVATAVANGDLTRTIAVEALGEVAELKDNINQMIANLRETTQYNMEQDWLKTNLARFTRMMQGERDLVTVCNAGALGSRPPRRGAARRLLRDAARRATEKGLELMASYAVSKTRQAASNARVRRRTGRAMRGYEKKRILVTNVPEDYVADQLGRIGKGSLHDRSLCFRFCSRAKFAR
jgi:HAMP domain-containing protein